MALLRTWVSSRSNPMSLYAHILKEAWTPEKRSAATTKAWLSRARSKAPKEAVAPLAEHNLTADTFKEAKSVAKKLGAPILRDSKDTLYRDTVEFLDLQHANATPFEREVRNYYNPDQLPSTNPKELSYARSYAKDYTQYEKKFEGKDPFDVSDLKKAAIQDMINYNHTLPAYANAVKKFGEAPLYAINFGKRTGLVQGASGQYEAGKVFINAEWVYSDKIRADDSFNAKGSTADSDGGNVYANGGLAGTIRHEQGHWIHSTKLPRDKAAEWDALHTAVSGLASKQNHLETGMGFDKQTPLKQISSYSQANSMESFAETFSLMTHPNFDRKKYGKEVQSMFDFMEKEILS